MDWSKEKEGLDARAPEFSSPLSYVSKAEDALESAAALLQDYINDTTIRVKWSAFKDLCKVRLARRILLNIIRTP